MEKGLREMGRGVGNRSMHVQRMEPRTTPYRSWVILICSLLLVGLGNPVFAQDGTPEPADGGMATQVEPPAVVQDPAPDPAGDPPLEGAAPESQPGPALPVEEDTEAQIPDEQIVEDQVPGEQTGQGPPAESAVPAGTPDPTPTPTPSPEAAIPFAPQLTCVPAPGGAPVTIGAAGWAYLDCSMTWQTQDVSSVRLKPLPPVPGWEIVPLNDRALDDPSLLALSPADLWLIDRDLADAGFLSATFSIATRLGCDAQPYVDLRLEFEATSGEQGTVEPWTGQLPITASPATLPDVTLTSAVFEPVDPATGQLVSNGAITMTYSNASVSCGWNATIIVGDFVSGDTVLPASALVLTDVAGAPGMTWSQEGGAITLRAAQGTDMATDGAITVAVSMPVPEDISDGDYSTTISSTVSPP